MLPLFVQLVGVGVFLVLVLDCWMIGEDEQQDQGDTETQTILMYSTLLDWTYLLQKMDRGEEGEETSRLKKN